MVLNFYIITYLICAVISLFIGSIATLTGYKIWKRWDITNSAETQYRLEKKVYLIISVLSIGFILRLFAFPLWFLTLNSMIISIPGAMCLAGVHNANAPLAYIASTFKLILPAIYGFWLILNLLDRKVATQPFMKLKLFLLTPLGLLILSETITDIFFLFSVPLRQVSCCTSLFDTPKNNLHQLISGSNWMWVVLFYVLALIILAEIIFFLIAQKKSTASIKKNWFGSKSLMLIETIMIIFCFITFLLALQTKISLLFLDLPLHHCIFCLCQGVWDLFLSFCMIMTGLTLVLIYFWIISSNAYISVDHKLSQSMLKLLFWSGGLLSSGLIILSIHLLWALA